MTFEIMSYFKQAGQFAHLFSNYCIFTVSLTVWCKITTIFISKTGLNDLKVLEWILIVTIEIQFMAIFSPKSLF